MVPESADEFVQGAVGEAEADVVADDLVGGVGNDTPGGESVLIEFLDAGWIVVMGWIHRS